MITGLENIYEEKDKNSILDSTDHLKEEIGVVEKKEEVQSTNAVEDNPLSVVSECVEGLKSGGIEVHEVVQDSILIDGMPNSVDSSKKEPGEKDSSRNFEPHDNSNSILLEEEDLKDKPSVLNSGDARSFPNKKLSASAAPFNPSPAIARAAPVTMNITLPSGPGVAPWPVNMTLCRGHAAVLPTVNPMCSSPHHPYPSPPPTPNMIQSLPLPFMYPPYTQPQAVPTSTFPVTSSAFHPSQFSWQCNVSPNVPDFIPRTVWPGCHPIEYSVPPTVVEPIADHMLEPKVQCDDSASLSSASILPVDIDNVEEPKKEVNLLAPEALLDNANEVAGVRLETVKENGHSNSCRIENARNEPSQNNSTNENDGCSAERKNDGEKTFSILIRGRRNRKQTLRMPISLLSRPYGSQSFKVIYNRVVRGSEAPKSTSFSSAENCTASAT